MMHTGRIIKILALSVLYVLLFEFVHSELDLITSEQDNHSAHDFCSLVEAASVIKSVDKSSELAKVHLLAAANFYSAGFDIKPTFHGVNLTPVACNIPNQEIYIINSSLLI